MVEGKSGTIVGQLEMIGIAIPLHLQPSIKMLFLGKNYRLVFEFVCSMFITLNHRVTSP